MALTIEVSNRSGAQFDEDALTALARAVLNAEGVAEGDLGLALVDPAEIRRLKREHLEQDEPTDVLAFPLDGLDELPSGIPRQLGDVVICPQVVGDDWQQPVVHGLLHLLGHDHGAAMEDRERRYAGARP